ncbi:MAG: 6-phosphogluconolactonase [Leptolyngbyaceae cyanobacterium MO_188.B28]|nr:6-phosphogluconolactonase [Leptolyngbyaceae cyanobacterium MO_188.B28]
MTPIVEILPDKPGLIDRALEVVVAQIKAAIADRGFCTIALAGGSTPKPLYAALSQQVLPWDKIHVFWGDERYVPSDHPDSNEGMAKAAWLSHVSIPAENIYPIPTTEGDPAESATQYEQTIKAFFEQAPDKNPSLDIILLGIGDDAHTASLFPHTEALDVQDRLVAVGNKDGQPRITLTAPFINQSRSVIFLAAGANKQEALTQIFAPEADFHKYPARLIKPEGELRWLLDAAAGKPLESYVNLGAKSGH